MIFRMNHVYGCNLLLLNLCCLIKVYNQQDMDVIISLIGSVAWSFISA